MYYTCRYCGHSGNYVTMHWDHSTPASQGGVRLVPACNTCNLQKGNKTPLQFARWLRDNPGEMRRGHPYQDSNRVPFVRRTLDLALW